MFREKKIKIDLSGINKAKRMEEEKPKKVVYNIVLIPQNGIAYTPHFVTSFDTYEEASKYLKEMPGVEKSHHGLLEYRNWYYIIAEDFA